MDAATGVAISSVASTVGVVLVAWLAFKTAKLSKAVEKIHVATNSMKDALVKTTAESSEAKGNLEGRKELKAEQHDQAQWGAVPPVIKPPPAP